MYSQHLLFLTPNNLATNPCLVIELKTAIELGATLTVIQFKPGNWSDNQSEQLKVAVSNETKKARGEKTVVKSEDHVLRGEKAVVSNEKIVWSDELRGANANKREV